MRLATSAPRTPPPSLIRSTGVGASNMTATVSASPTNAVPNATEPSPLVKGGDEPPHPELIGPPPPPPAIADPKVTVAGPLEPTTSDTNRLASISTSLTPQPDGPPFEITAGGPAVGIRTLDNSARVAITPQMLVRFFSRKTNPALPNAPTDAPGDPGTSTETEAWIPVEFVPPQPPSPSASSSATYQLLPKP